MRISLIILIAFHFVFIGCNSKSTTGAPLEYTPIPNNIPPVNNTNQTGTMTNQSPQNIEPVQLNADTKINKDDLLRYVKNAIIPEYKDWVVFDNGTYVVFDNVDTVADVQFTAKQWLRHYTPKKPEDHYWPFSITDLDKEDAWSVFGNGYGIYTIVHANELSSNPDPQQIGAFAKAKRAIDEKNLKVIFVSTPAGVESIK